MKHISFLTFISLALSVSAAPLSARGIADGTLNNAHVASDISILNTLVGSSTQKVENNNANTRADGCNNNSLNQIDKRWCRRGIADGSLNNAHILSNIDLLNVLVNSKQQRVENNNANTKAKGKDNNSVKQFDKRILDGSLNNAHIADHISVGNVHVDSETTEAQNNNANTKARGKGNNSINQLDKRILDGSLNNAHILDQISALNTLINSETSQAQNNNANTEARGKGNNSIKQLDKRVLDGSLNNLHLIDNISLLNTNINSKSSEVQNNNANTEAKGNCNNSVNGKCGNKNKNKNKNKKNKGKKNKGKGKSKNRRNNGNCKAY
ncbi:uncharacterized protein VTP21DRAFT_5020 [Calcarisporiella thermophila]|uniref:uncharacterized protein n=1 Tax=Calcarisporiella thermophila TaxID=911321 RepID=UPI003742FDE1